MEIKEIIKALLIAAPIEPSDARQAIELAQDCEIELSGLDMIADSIGGDISDDCDEWDFLPDEILAAIWALDPAGWARLRAELPRAIELELKAYEAEIQGMIIDERRMAPIRREAAAILAAAPAPDWAALIAASEWAAMEGQKHSYERAYARRAIARPIAFELAPGASLRRALIERMADDPALCALL